MLLKVRNSSFSIPDRYRNLYSSDVSGVIHTATVVSFSSVAEEVIDPVVNGALSILRSAATQPTITRFVLTSSGTACDYTRPNEVYSLDENSWNEVSVEEAYKKNEGFIQGFHVYGASKTLSEKAAWKFIQDEKPAFVLNTILPGFTLGRILDPASQQGSTASMLKRVVEKEDFAWLEKKSGQYFFKFLTSSYLYIFP